MNEDIKERPIIFKAEMVNAILAGRKTQTRRVVKEYLPKASAKACPDDVRVEIGGFTHRGCPQGKPGDRLWVRETWGVAAASEEYFNAALKGENIPGVLIRPPEKWAKWILYKADGGFFHGTLKRWRPPIHMFRWASRILLEMTSLRIERLNEISERDCEAEGIRVSDPEHGNAGAMWFDHEGNPYNRAWCAYQSLWESINGPGSFDDRWVWVEEFKVITNG